MKEVNEDDLRTMIICSFRYAISTKDYIAPAVGALIKLHHKVLGQANREQLINEIKCTIKNKTEGMNCDEKVWLDLVQFLEDDL